MVATWWRDNYHCRISAGSTSDVPAMELGLRHTGHCAAGLNGGWDGEVPCSFEYSLYSCEVLAVSGRAETVLSASLLLPARKLPKIHDSAIFVGFHKEVE